MTSTEWLARVWGRVRILGVSVGGPSAPLGVDLVGEGVHAAEMPPEDLQLGPTARLLEGCPLGGGRPLRKALAGAELTDVGCQARNRREPAKGDHGGGLGGSAVGGGRRYAQKDSKIKSKDQKTQNHFGC